MTFGAIHAQFLSLKKRLTIHVGAQALPEITVDAPKGNDDELSFIRLVCWAYVLLHESGKISLNFLKDLPPLNQGGKLLPHVRGLRTWTSHNLSFEKSADVDTMKIAIVWFQRTCGTGTPTTTEQWAQCFNQLCSEVSEILTGLILACDNLESEDDGPDLIEELKKRVNKNWDAYRFDPYVEASAKSLGFVGLKVVDFRNRFLEKWRKLLQLLEESKIDQLLRQKIEADMLDVMGNALPFTSEELLKNFDLEGPNEVATLMLLLRAQRGKYQGDISELLRRLQESGIAEEGSRSLALSGESNTASCKDL